MDLYCGTFGPSNNNFSYQSPVPSCEENPCKKEQDSSLFQYLRIQFRVERKRVAGTHLGDRVAIIDRVTVHQKKPQRARQNSRVNAFHVVFLYDSFPELPRCVLKVRLAITVVDTVTTSTIVTSAEIVPVSVTVLRQ